MSSQTMKISTPELSTPDAGCSPTSAPTVEITLTISPPSLAPTPKPSDDDLCIEASANDTSRGLNEAPPAPPSATLSPQSLHPRSHANSLSSNSSFTSASTACDSRVSSFSRSDSKLDLLRGGDRNEEDITTYHVYKTGRAKRNFSLHTEPNSSVKSPSTSSSPGTKSNEGCCLFKNLRRKISFGTGGNETNKPKTITPNNSEMDPKKASYYLHKPCIYFHSPPQTLRFKGDKSAPVVCLVSGSFYWRVWRFDFIAPEEDPEGKKRFLFFKKKRTDSGFSKGDDAGAGDAQAPQRRWTGLNEPGVMDGRGVVVSKYPPRKSGHWKGETGKQFQQERTKRQKSSPQARNKASSNPNQGPGRSNSSSTAKQSSNNPEMPETHFPAGPNVEDLPEHLRPESLDKGSLLMHWMGWFTREYVFTHRVIEYRWKGTKKVGCEKDPWYKFSPFSHLKLIATIPEEEIREEQEGCGANKEATEKEKKAPRATVRRERSFSSFVSTLRSSDTFSSIGDRYIRDGGKKKEKEKIRAREVVVATYSCTKGKRKCGGLKVSEEALEKISRLRTQEDIGDIDTAREVRKERLRHVVIATGLCMMQGEQQKKAWAYEIALAVVTEVLQNIPF
ncbi:hypothetical protein RUND412_003729 [Rhizina undulata]